MIVPGMFVCSSFLISVCMFIVPKALLISNATVMYVMYLGVFALGVSLVSWIMMISAYVSLIM